MADAERVYTSTGFDPIDDEHEALSLAIAAFVEKVNAGKVDAVREALEGVIRGVGDHFAHEERWMAELAYPNRARHGEAHQVFLRDARRQADVLAKAGVTPEFRRWAVGRLPDWFGYHILAHDMGLARFLLKAGVTAAVA